MRRRARLVLVLVGAGSAVTLDGDPAGAGATLRIVTAGGTPAEQTFELPAAGWPVLPAVRFKYTNTSSGSHAAARTAVRDRLLDWIFVAAPRVAAMGTNSTTSLSFNQSTVTFSMGSSCPAGEIDDGLTSGTKGPGLDVVGVRRHPGFFDGDDHAIAASEFTTTNGATCNGTFRWTQAHDSSNSHAAAFWWKTRSLRAASPGLLGALPTG